VTSRRALELLPGRFAVCLLAPDTPVPAWASPPAAGICSVTRTASELSIVCDESRVPADVARAERGWRAFRVRGPIPFSELGVVAGITAPLAAAGIPVFVISTFDTDYLLVAEARVDSASAALEAVGFEVE